MNVNLVSSLAQFKIGKLVAAEDFADKFHYQVTCVVLLLVLALVGVKQYVFTPIQCWIPHEWDSSWEEFSENYCWVQDTYYSSVSKGPQRTQSERNEARIGYYQWVPFILLTQTVSFYLPHLLWQAMSSRLGTDLNQMVRLASQTATIDPVKRKAMVTYLAREVHLIVQNNIANQPNRRHQSRLFHFWHKKRCGLSLVVFYLFMKLIYILVGFLNLVGMRDFFEMRSNNDSTAPGYGSLLFGWKMFYDLLCGKQWQVSGKFPRVTWCDVPRKFVGGYFAQSIMCVLPLNMLNEKIFVFLWFWISVGIVFMFLSIGVWIFRLVFLRNRRQFVKKYLRIFNVIEERDHILAKEFTRKFMRYDGIFLLKMIALNAGELATAEVVGEVWRLWRESKSDLYDNNTSVGRKSLQQEQMEETAEHSISSRRKSVDSELKYRAPGPPLPPRSSVDGGGNIYLKSPENMRSSMHNLP